MRIKIIPVLSAAFLLSAMMVSVASAITASAVVPLFGEQSTKARAQATDSGNATSTEAREHLYLKVEAREQGNATSTAAKVNKIDAFTIKQARVNATSTDANAKGQLTAEAHRSTVAAFVQSLLNVANREGGIGAQVRVIARTQSDSASTTAEAIAKVENRGKLRTFLFGSDYKSLGQLRSEIATTNNNIEQLKDLIGKATSDADKAELSAQIQVLEDSQAKIDAFVIKQASTFSLFGWLKQKKFLPSNF